MPPINDSTRFSFKAASIIASVTFIVICTWNVSKFMNSVQGFQTTTDIRLGALEASMRISADATREIREEQRSLYDDRWRASDMKEWRRSLDYLNREVLRENGSKGLLVPDAIGAPQKIR